MASNAEVHLHPFTGQEPVEHFEGVHGVDVLDSGALKVWVGSRDAVIFAPHVWTRINTHNED